MGSIFKGRMIQEQLLNSMSERYTDLELTFVKEKLRSPEGQSVGVHVGEFFNGVSDQLKKSTDAATRELYKTK
jgi:hypothetical protein